MQSNFGTKELIMSLNDYSFNFLSKFGVNFLSKTFLYKLCECHIYFCYNKMFHVLSNLLHVLQTQRVIAKKALLAACLLAVWVSNLPPRPLQGPRGGGVGSQEDPVKL